ncbi:MAG: hypothetical protein SGI72_05440 [Planctomycetota bacterium]|nr:hypothetical protein [Planctomycetota bacterium]
MPTRLVLILVTVLFSACTEAGRVDIVFRPVVAAAVAALEKDVPPPPPIPAPAFEFSSRVRARVESLAADPGPMHAMLALSTRDFGDAAVPVLAQVLGEANSGTGMRIAAAEMLAVLDSPDAAAVLVYHATENPVRWLRAQCAWRLASTTQDQCVPPLLEAIALERDGEVRAFSGSTLAHFGCTTFGSNENPPTPSKRFELAVWKRVIALTSGADTADVQRRERAITTFGLLPDSFAKRFAEALHDEHDDVRRVAARTLEHMGLRAEIAGPALLESLLGDPSIEVEAIAGLGAVHYTPAVSVIVERLADGSRPLAVRTAAARAVGALEAPLGIDALIHAHAANEPRVLRIAAADALCSLGRVEIALPTLTQALASGGTESEAAATALDRWLARLARDGNARARSIVEERTKSRLSPAEFAKLLTEAWKDLVR